MIQSASEIRANIDEVRRRTGSLFWPKHPHGSGLRGEDCTFETLLKVFHIRDKKVLVMAQVVHDADLFDEKFGRKEGFGIDEVMKGWAREGLSDQELLKRGLQLADGLYKSLG